MAVFHVDLAGQEIILKSAICILFSVQLFKYLWCAVADPDLHVTGGHHPEPEIRGGGLKKIFSALRASVWSKNKGGGQGPPGPLSWIRHWCVLGFKI